MITESYLIHHGVKGQKWGVMHGPPYPLKKQYNVKRGVADKSYKTKKLPSSLKTLIRSTPVLAYNAILFSQGFYNPMALVVSASDILNMSVKSIKDYIGANESNKIVKILESESANEKIDTKTGFLKKNREMSIEEDTNRVNPMYDNPVYNAKMNCALCSVSYDLRRRGFDVSANLSSKGYTDKEIEKIYKDAKFEPYFGSSYGYSKNAVNDSEYSRFSESMNKSAGKRGLVSIGWKGHFSGHEMAYEKTNSGYVFIDAQMRKQYSAEEFEKMIKKKAGCITYMRTDNKQFNLEELENVTKKYV